MKLIVGLGNIGTKFENTRHNVGFSILDAYIANKGLSWQFEKNINALIAKENNVIFIKPQAYMNDSGESVSKAFHYYQILLDDLVVIHDDVDLDVGQVRYKKGMSSAGHHGVEDIIQKLNSKDFWRLRIGIGRPDNIQFDVKDYVLQKFNDIDFQQFLSHKVFEDGLL